jgi:hypothetical protein
VCPARLAHRPPQPGEVARGGQLLDAHGLGGPPPVDPVLTGALGDGGAWTWSLVRRADEDRAGVLATADALCAGVGDLGIQAPDACLPAGDPHAVKPGCGAA